VLHKHRCQARQTIMLLDGHPHASAPRCPKRQCVACSSSAMVKACRRQDHPGRHLNMMGLIHSRRSPLGSRRPKVRV